jgi:hypothetical protein
LISNPLESFACSSPDDLDQPAFAHLPGEHIDAGFLIPSKVSMSSSLISPLLRSRK